MGVRANLYEETRKCVNVLQCNHLSRKAQCNRCNYLDDFPKSIMYVTRRHLRETAHTLIDCFEENDSKNVRCHLIRYYKLSALHTSQLKRYNSRRLDNLSAEAKFLEANVMYLQRLSYMFSKLFKEMQYNYTE